MNRQEYTQRKKDLQEKHKLRVIDLVPVEGKSNDMFEEVITEVQLHPPHFYHAENWKTKKNEIVQFGKNVIITPASATIISDAAGVELAMAPVIEKKQEMIEFRGAKFKATTEVVGKILFKKRMADGQWMHNGYVTSRDIDVLLQEDIINKLKNPSKANPTMYSEETMEMDIFKKRNELTKHAFQIVDTKLRKAAIKMIGLPVLTIEDVNSVIFVAKYVLNRANPLVQQTLLSGTIEVPSIPHFDSNETPKVEMQPIAKEEHDAHLAQAEDIYNEGIVETVIEDAQAEVVEENKIGDALSDYVISGIEENEVICSYVQRCVENDESEECLSLILEYFKQKEEKGTGKMSSLAISTTLTKKNPTDRNTVDMIVAKKDVQSIINLLKPIDIY